MAEFAAAFLTADLSELATTIAEGGN